MNFNNLIKELCNSTQCSFCINPVVHLVAFKVVKEEIKEELPIKNDEESFPE